MVTPNIHSLSPGLLKSFKRANALGSLGAITSGLGLGGLGVASGGV